MVTANEPISPDLRINPAYPLAEIAAFATAIQHLISGAFVQILDRVSQRDPFNLNPPRRRRRRRRGMTAAAAVAALLSWAVYQFTGKPDASAPTANRDRAATVSERSASPAARSAPAAAAGTTPPTGTNNFNQPNESFAFYMMALSLHPAFCENGNDSKKDCRALSAQDHERRPLVIHGLWPENLQPESYPRDCAGDRLSLSASLRTRLEDWMPGMATGLHSHEWRKHGTCSGLSGTEYFEQSIALAERGNAALRQVLLASIDKQVSADELRAAANVTVPGYGDTITFHCQNIRSPDPAKRGRPYLIEVRHCIDNDGPSGAPGTPLACRSVQRRDQGCGARFWIDGV